MIPSYSDVVEVMAFLARRYDRAVLPADVLERLLVIVRSLMTKTALPEAVVFFVFSTRPKAQRGWWPLLVYMLAMQTARMNGRELLRSRGEMRAQAMALATSAGHN